MPHVEIAYVDESYDDSVFTMSALVVQVGQWRAAFDHLRALRTTWKRDHGIFSGRELHATEFVPGRGRIADRMIAKALRAQLFKDFLQHLAAMPGARIFGGAWRRSGDPLWYTHAKAFSRIQERLQTRCTKRHIPVQHILMVVDEGREAELRRISRRSKVFNAVGSQLGAWEDGASYKNIPNDRLVEDPVFKPSQQSVFLQAVDFVAYSLLKSEVAPTNHIARYGLNDCYRLLGPILGTEASPRDPKGHGIVRT